MRKGQGLSLNVIVIAAIALLVLVIISVIFASRSQIFGTETRSCANKGGTCRENGCFDNEAQIGDSSNTDCPNVCCLPVYKSGS
ncbi:MAG: hypothetical protein ACQESG_02790 [Nanobdellota archaeon]